MAGRYEETHHHFAKIVWHLTPKRTSTLQADLFTAFQYIEKVKFICREVGGRRTSVVLPLIFGV
jgi:hypothetical protein